MLEKRSMGTFAAEDARITVNLLERSQRRKSDHDKVTRDLPLQCPQGHELDVGIWRLCISTDCGDGSLYFQVSA